MEPTRTSVLILGAGPGGYTAAIRAGQLGLNTMIVDRQKPGGTCLNVGCIPSKALIHVAEEFDRAQHFSGNAPTGISVANPALDLGKTVQWKDGIVKRLNGGVAGLLKRHKVTHLTGSARILDGKTVEIDLDGGGVQRVSCDHLILATGSVPVELPFLPFSENVLSSTQALSLTAVPTSLAVVGGGYIGLELGMAYAKMGAGVSVIEMADRILPSYDAELTAPVLKRAKALGMDIRLQTKAKGLSNDQSQLIIEGPDGKQGQVPAEKTLVTVGRKPYTEGYGLEDLRLDRDGDFIRIDGRCRTSMRNVYAIGDLSGEPMLAHRAIAQGEMVAEIIAGHKRVWDKQVIPAICFTDPEVVSAGLSPEEARAAGHEIKSEIFPFAANGRAMTMEAEDGFVRIVARADNHVVLGIQGVGGGIAELSSAFGLAIEMGARLEDIAGTIHAHPTQGEAFQEAALRALGHAIHI